MLFPKTMALWQAMDAMTNACPPTSNDATSTVISRTGATDCPSVGEVQRACTAAGGKYDVGVSSHMDTKFIYLISF